MLLVLDKMCYLDSMEFFVISDLVVIAMYVYKMQGGGSSLGDKYISSSSRLKEDNGIINMT